MIRPRACLVLVSAVVAGLLVPAPAALAAPGDPTGLPDGVPAAALRSEPVLPAPAAWPFGETWSRTSGTGRLGGGASFWTDWVYDDHGPAVPLPVTPSTSSLVSNLAPTQGVYDYPAGPAAGNGADVFRSAVGVDAQASYWRVDWGTLVDPDVPLAVWGIDLDDDPATGTGAFPGAAGVTAPGQDRFLVVSSRGARLLGGAAPVDLPVVVDQASRSFVARVPSADLSLPAASRLRLVAGLADAAGTAFAPPVLLGGLPALSGTRVYNATFRTHDQEPPVYREGDTAAGVAALGDLLAGPPLDGLGLDGLERFVTGNFWMEDHQADALARGDVSEFSLRVDWGQLRARTATPEPFVTGYSNRWYVSNEDLGQGVVPDAMPPGDLEPNYLGRVQPYAVQVPEGVGPGAPLTFVLHSLGVNHNQYGALNPRMLADLCDARGSICATTLGRGPDLWYFDEAEADFWQVWREVAETYRPSTERTVISGYSMGGWATYKLGLAHPDLFARAMSIAGPPTCGIALESGLRFPIDAFDTGTCGADGETLLLAENAREVPYGLSQGVVDQLVPFTSVLEQQQELDRLGYRHRLELYAVEDHLLYAVQDRFDSQVAAIGQDPARTRDPARVTYRWYPDLADEELGIGTTTAYWVTALQAADATPGTTARVDAVSRAIPDPAVEQVRTSGLLTEPTPGTLTELAWTLGAAPAAAQRLELDLTGVSALTVDAPRARLACGAVVQATSTGASRLTVTGLAGGDRVVDLPAGESASTLACAASAAPATAPVTAPGPVAAPGRLPDTGGSPVAGLLALTALGLAAAVRRRRIG